MQTKIYVQKTVTHSLSKLLLCLAFVLPVLWNTASAQVCSGSWNVNEPLSYDCITGEYIGSVNPSMEVPGCPVNPVYIAGQSNTFTFSNPVSSFSIDLNAFSTGPGCARLEVKINGVFYPMSAANISPIVTSGGVSCSGENVMTVTGDGYLTSNAMSTLQTNGQATLNISGVNASSVTFSTNDGAGTVFTDPYNCISVVPLKLKNFSGRSARDCKATLSWESETESNIKNIEVLRSDDGLSFKTVSTLTPLGSYSLYTIQTDNYTDAYFRLKINDLDGDFEYSEILNIESNCNKLAYAVSPNPVYGSLAIKGLRPNDKVFIFDMLGRKILNFNPSPQSKDIDVQKLAAGIYNIQIINAGMIKANIRIIKK